MHIRFAHERKEQCIYEMATSLLAIIIPAHAEMKKFNLLGLCIIP